MQTQKRWPIGLLAVVLLVGCSLSAFFAGAVVGGLVGGKVGYSIAEKRTTVAYTPPTVVPLAPTWEPPPPEPPRRIPPGREMRLAALVVGIVPDGPADEAGIKLGDLILAVDDQEVSLTWDLADIIQAYKPGDRVRLTLLRDGQEERVRVRLGRRRTDDGGVVASLGLTYRLEPVMPFR